MFSESFWISVISAIVGPTIVLYIANRIKNGKPKADRIDTAFEVYEKIIKRLDDENTKLRAENETLIMRLQAKGKE